MKFFFILSGLFLMSCNKSSTPSTSNADPVYLVGVSFNSICCGPPSDDFLKSFVKKFNSANNVKLSADKIGGCGKEGEFVVLFGLSNIKESTKEKFISEIEKLIPFQEAEFKSANSSSGGLQVLRNVKASEYNHCRVKPQSWVY